jgi:type IV fimbrial biogenesis protein FimT
MIMNTNGNRPPSSTYQTGVTLIELLVALAVLAVFVVWGIPSFNSIFDNKRLTGAAQAMHADFQFARAQAIKSNKGVSVNFVEGANWCYGITDAAPFSDCVCNTASAASCTVEGVQRIVSATQFPNISLSEDFAGTSVEFDPVRGGAGNGSARFQNADGSEVRADLSPSGRARLCSFPTDYAGYKLC